MVIKKPLTDEQIKKIAERTKPAQDDINAAASALFLHLMQRVADLEENLKQTAPD